MSEVSITSLIDDVKASIKDAGQQGVKLAEAEIKINVTSARTAEGQVKFGPVELGATIKKSETQEVVVTFTPGNASISSAYGRANLRQDLTAHIKEIGRTVKAAAEGQVPFNLKEATIELGFAVESSGAIKVVVGGKTERADTHGLKLTLTAA